MILSTSAWLQNILIEKKDSLFLFRISPLIAKCRKEHTLYIPTTLDMNHVKKQYPVVPTRELIECNLLWGRTHFDYKIIKATAKRAKKVEDKIMFNFNFLIIDDVRKCELLLQHIERISISKSVPYHNVRETWVFFFYHEFRIEKKEIFNFLHFKVN